MNIYLCGYHQIGCDVLNHLLSNCWYVENIAVFTHEPSMSHIPDIREIAGENGLWHTIESVNKISAPFEPDVIASVYYRNIIKEPVLERAGWGSFNIHPSLLQRHRGCSSVPWAIINGDDITGVTFHYMDKGIDTGNIILQAAIQIDGDETQKSLYNKCMKKGAEYWPAALDLLCDNFAGVAQEGESTYHKRGVPYDGKIDNFLEDAYITDVDWLEKLEKFIRAMDYPPYSYATYKGIEVKDIDDFHDINAQQKEEERYG